MSIKPKVYSIGIDVGGTKMAGILFDGQKVIADYILGTPKDNLEHFMVMMQALITPLEEKARDLKIKISGIGLGLAGVINYNEGKMVKSQNIPIIDNAKIANILSSRTGYSVALDNDCNCFVRSEVLAGAAKEYKNVYGIILGTGIGGAWWYNNEVYRGTHGNAGEPGAMIIDFANNIKFESAYHKLFQNNPERVAEEAYRGDVLAQKAFKEFGQMIGLAFANIINIVDPEVIVVGGSVTQVTDLYLQEAKKAMRENVQSKDAIKVKILKSKIGEYAGAVGAAMLVNQTSK